jgi:hypothetical protein
MIEALVSGQRGLAFVTWQPGQLYVMRRGGRIQLIPTDRLHLGMLAGDAGDFLFLRARTLAEVDNQLARATARERALQALSIAFNAALSPELRRDSIRELDRSLDSAFLPTVLENVTFSVPLSADVDLDGLQTIAEAEGAERLLGTLRRLYHVQPIVRIVHREWGEIPAERFGSLGKRTWTAIATAAGFFREFVLGNDELIAEAVERVLDGLGAYEPGPRNERRAVLEEFVARCESGHATASQPTDDSAVVMPTVAAQQNLDDHVTPGQDVADLLAGWDAQTGQEDRLLELLARSEQAPVIETERIVTDLIDRRLVGHPAETSLRRACLESLARGPYPSAEPFQRYLTEPQYCRPCYIGLARRKMQYAAEYAPAVFRTLARAEHAVELQRAFGAVINESYEPQGVSTLMQILFEGIEGQYFGKFLDVLRQIKISLQYASPTSRDSDLVVRAGPSDNSKVIGHFSTNSDERILMLHKLDPIALSARRLSVLEMLSI